MGESVREMAWKGGKAVGGGAAEDDSLSPLVRAGESLHSEGLPFSENGSKVQQVVIPPAGASGCSQCCSHFPAESFRAHRGIP